MIIYGVGKKQLEEINITGATCPHCKADTTWVRPQRRYFHIYGIPMFPLNRIGEIECRSCRNTSDITSHPPEIQEDATALIKGTATPRVLFAGMYVMGIIFIIGTFFGWQRDKNSAAYAAEPHVSDLYVMKTDVDPKYKYVACRIVNMTQDSVTFAVSEYGYRSASDAEERISEEGRPLDERENLMVVGKNSLPRMLEEGVVERVVRPD